MGKCSLLHALPEQIRPFAESDNRPTVIAVISRPDTAAHLRCRNMHTTTHHMQQSIKKVNYAVALSLGLLIAACGTNKAGDDSGTEYSTEQVESKVTPTGDTVAVLLQTDDNMKYDKSEIKVKEGQVVKLILHHKGTMPKKAMGHNFVLLKQGVDLEDFGNAAAKAKSPDFNLPSDIMSKAIANTPMIGGGETVTIEFLTPAKGTYQYLCSYPGHYGMMQGVFIVE